MNSSTRALVLLAFALAALVHLPSLQLCLLNEDYAIVEKVHRQGLGESLRLAFTERYLDFVLPFYRPVAQALFSVQAALFGPDVTGYHLVTLGFLLGACFFLFRLALWLAPDRPLVAALLALGYAVLPAHVESTSWTIAGQQEHVAVCFAAGACLMLARGSLWTFPLALLAYGSKESAFGLAALLPAMGWLLPSRAEHAIRARGEEAAGQGPRRSPLLLGLAHPPLALLAFGGRNLVIGGYENPYQQAGVPQASLLDRLLAHLPDLPAAFLTASGPGAVLIIGGAVLGLTVATAAEARALASRAARTRVHAWGRPVLALLALPGLALPLLALDLGNVARDGVNVRYFIPTLLGGYALAALAASRARHPAWLALPIAGVLWSAGECKIAYEPMLSRSARVRAVVEGIAEAPGETLLVARLPGDLRWSYPSAQRAPFREPERLTFPLRVGTKEDADVLPIRPLPPGMRVARVHEGSVLAFEEAAAVDAPPLSVLTEEAPMRWRLREEAAPLSPRAIEVLDLGAAPGTQGQVRLETDLGPRLLPFTAPVEPLTLVPIRIPLCDLPGWPAVAIRSLVIEGARPLAFSRLPGRLRLLTPEPGTLQEAHDEATVTRPFAFVGLPAGTRALRVTLLSPNGAAGPMTIPCTPDGQGDAPTVLPEISWGALVAAGTGPPSFFDYVLRTGQKAGTERVHVTFEALAFPQNPHSVLDRACLVPFRVRL